MDNDNRDMIHFSRWKFDFYLSEPKLDVYFVHTLVKVLVPQIREGVRLLGLGSLGS